MEVSVAATGQPRLTSWYPRSATIGLTTASCHAPGTPNLNDSCHWLPSLQPSGIPSLCWLQVSLAKPLITLLSKEYHIQQQQQRPNVVQALLEGVR